VQRRVTLNNDAEFRYLNHQVTESSSAELSTTLADAMCGGWETNRSRLGQFLYLMLRDPFGQR